MMDNRKPYCPRCHESDALIWSREDALYTCKACGSELTVDQMLGEMGIIDYDGGDTPEPEEPHNYHGARF